MHYYNRYTYLFSLYKHISISRIYLLLICKYIVENEGSKKPNNTSMIALRDISCAAQQTHNELCHWIVKLKSDTNNSRV